MMTGLLLSLNFFTWNFTTVSASFRFSLFFEWPRLCQDQATCAQPEALGRENRHRPTTITKQL